MTGGPVRPDDWDHHWSEFGVAAAASPAKAFRHRLIVAALAEGGVPPRILDIGSGSGDLAARLAPAFPDAQIVGLELSRVGVELARERVPGARFLERDLTRPAAPEPQLAGWAAAAVCSEVLEHVDDPAGLLRNCRPYLAPGCRLVVTVPGGPISAFDRRIGHRRHFDAGALAAVLADAGFAVDWVRGAGFPFFNLYRLAVVARGERLAADVGAARGRPSPLARLAMGGFAVLLRASSGRRGRGWQLVAAATLAPQAAGVSATQRTDWPKGGRIARSTVRDTGTTTES